MPGKSLWSMVVLVVSALFLILAVMMISSIVPMALVAGGVVPEIIPSGAMTQLMFIILSVLIIFAIGGRERFAVKRAGFGDLIRASRFAFLLAIVVQVIFYLILPGDIDTGRGPAAGMSFAETVVFVWLLASFAEELFFRGVIQGMLKPFSTYGIKLFSLSIPASAVISGLFFGFMHLALLSTGADIRFVSGIVISAVVLGVTAGCFREKTNSIWAAVIVHMIFNMTGTLAGFLLS